MPDTFPEAPDGFARFVESRVSFSFQDHVFGGLLRYREDDPYAVLLKVDANSDEKDWRFSRSLLTEALAYRIPEPLERLDVVVERRGEDGELLDVVLAASRPPQSVLTFETSDVQEFLRVTVALVPLGGESAAIDWTAAEKALDLAPGQLTGRPRK